MPDSIRRSEGRTIYRPSSDIGSMRFPRIVGFWESEQGTVRHPPLKAEVAELDPEPAVRDIARIELREVRPPALVVLESGVMQLHREDLALLAADRPPR